MRSSREPLTPNDVRRLVAARGPTDATDWEMTAHAERGGVLVVLFDMGDDLYACDAELITFRYETPGGWLPCDERRRDPATGQWGEPLARVVIDYTDPDCLAVELVDGRIVIPHEGRVARIVWPDDRAGAMARSLRFADGERPPVRPDTPASADFFAEVWLTELDVEFTDRNIWLRNATAEWDREGPGGAVSFWLDRLTGDPAVDRPILDGPLEDIFFHAAGPPGRFVPDLQLAVAARPELLRSLRHLPISGRRGDATRAALFGDPDEG